MVLFLSLEFQRDLTKQPLVEVRLSAGERNICPTLGRTGPSIGGPGVRVGWERQGKVLVLSYLQVSSLFCALESSTGSTGYGDSSP